MVDEAAAGQAFGQASFSRGLEIMIAARTRLMRRLALQ
jgi:hypothetical protein